jgi:hypothetical protein
MKISTLIGISLVTNLVLSCAATNKVADTETASSAATIKTSSEIEETVKDGIAPIEEAIDEVIPNQKKWVLDEKFAELNLNGIDNPKLFIDKNNITYMVYIKKPERSISVLKYSNNIWEPLTAIGMTSEKVYKVGLSFDNNNIPYIFYAGEKGNVIKFSDGKWVKVGAPFSKGEALSIKLSFDNINSPWVAYGDSENDIKSTVKQYSQGKWIGMGSGLPDVAEPIYLSHDFEDPLLMTLKTNFGNDPIETYQLINDKWIIKSKGENLLPSVFFDVLVSSENEIYLAYSDKQTDYKLTVKKFINNKWELVGNEGISEGTPRSISIEKNESNLPIIVYYDSGNESICKKEWNGSTWETIGTEHQYSGDLVSRSSISSNNVSYMIFLYKEKSQLFKIDE